MTSHTIKQFFQPYRSINLKVFLLFLCNTFNPKNINSFAYVLQQIDIKPPNFALYINNAYILKCFSVVICTIQWNGCGQTCRFTYPTRGVKRYWFHRPAELDKPECYCLMKLSAWRSRLFRLICAGRLAITAVS
jgi:hypothetical protein